MPFPLLVSGALGGSGPQAISLATALCLQTAALAPVDLTQATWRLHPVSAETQVVDHPVMGASFLAATRRPLHGDALRRSAIWESDEWMATVQIEITPAGCQRLTLLTSKSVPVALPAGVLNPSNRNNTGAQQLWSTGSVPVYAVDSLERRNWGRGIVEVKLNNEPAIGVRIALKTLARGDFLMMGGNGPAHNHMERSPHPVTLKIAAYDTRGETYMTKLGNNQLGQELEVKTDNTGRAEMFLIGGMRGGAEAVQARILSPTAEGSNIELRKDVTFASVIIRHKQFVHFTDGMPASVRTPDNRTIASRGHPYWLIGQTAAHPANHYVDRDILTRMRGLFQEAHRVHGRMGVAGRPYPKNLTDAFFMLNDMSLEYGGRFSVTGACHVAGNAHAGHRHGVEVDVRPCFGRADNYQSYNGAACVANAQNAGPAAAYAINEALFAAIIGKLDGTLHEEGDGLNAHYHIRLHLPPTASAPTPQSPVGASKSRL
jgi:hypothetical protein